jgi:hypothetical protein
MRLRDQVRIEPNERLIELANKRDLLWGKYRELGERLKDFIDQTKVYRRNYILEESRADCEGELVVRVNDASGALFIALLSFPEGKFTQPLLFKEYDEGEHERSDN